MVNNHVMLIGRLATEPELRAFNSSKGTPVPCTSFRLAVNRIYEDQADFFSVSVTGAMAKNLCEYQHKGSQIAVSGALRQNIWTDRQGAKHYDIEIRADGIQYLDGAAKGTEEAPPTDVPEYTEEALDAESIDSLDQLFRNGGAQ